MQNQPSNASSLERLFEPQCLSEVAKEAYITFVTQVINQIRPLTSKIENSTVQRTVTINQESLKAIQSDNVTTALIVLLDVIVECKVLALWRVPSKPVIAKAPNFIVAQASLLAGSNLVRRLKEKGVNSMASTDVWEKEILSMR